MPDEDFVFAFLPNDGYYIQVGGKRRWRNMVPSLLPKLAGSGKEGPVRFLSFSASSATDYAVVYRRENGEVVLDCAPHSSTAAVRLRDWLSWQPEPTRQRFLSNLRIAIGRPASFFAESAGKYRWGGLRERLESRLQMAIGCDADGNTDGGWIPTQRPSLVSFGVEGMDITSLDYGRACKHPSLGKHYPKMWECINKWETKVPLKKRMKFVAMNPFQLDEHFILFDDGSVDWKVNPELEEVFLELQAGIKQYGVRPSTTTPLYAGKHVDRTIDAAPPVYETTEGTLGAEKRLGLLKISGPERGGRPSQEHEEVPVRKGSGPKVDLEYWEI